MDGNRLIELPFRKENPFVWRFIHTFNCRVAEGTYHSIPPNILYEGGEILQNTQGNQICQVIDCMSGTGDLVFKFSVNLDEMGEDKHVVEE